MKEEEMFDPMIEYLKKNGYEIIEQHRGREKGPDIVAKKNGLEIVLEMKGDSAALDVDLGTCIGQLFRSIRGEKKDYAIALSTKYRRLLRGIEYPMKKLGVKAFVVSEKEIEAIW
jgi:Holliday junction resolvase